ncbi:MAG: KH domain-containing protein [Victivallaceae bacterium]|nr:KH domain-containing protein [Victivallaceae bacterium]
MFSFLKKLFCGDGDECSSCHAAGNGGGDIETFVDYVVRKLVDSPDAVKVESEDSDTALNIRIICNEEDRGKIIGRRGKTINAIRSLANGAAGRLQKKVTVEVVD